MMYPKICMKLIFGRQNMYPIASGPWSLHGDGGEVVVRAAVLAVAGHLVPRRHPHAEVARQHGGAADEVEIAYRVLQQLPAHFTAHLGCKWIG